MTMSDVMKERYALSGKNSTVKGDVVEKKRIFAYSPTLTTKLCALKLKNTCYYILNHCCQARLEVENCIQTFFFGGGGGGGGKTHNVSCYEAAFLPNLRSKLILHIAIKSNFR